MTNDEGIPAGPVSSFPYDAVLLVSFGGPERAADVLPFLENVTRGKNVPAERLKEVAAHYAMFGGLSPINDSNRALLAALVRELNAHGPHLPVYWGNRHWHPLLADTLRQMADDGVRRALAFVTSAFGSYPGCRQYLEDIDRARTEVGDDAPQVDKLRLFYNHPGFIEALADRVAAALAEVPAERRPAARLVYTAHSIPTAMAERCPYERQLREACGLVWERLGGRGQSHFRSGENWDSPQGENWDSPRSSGENWDSPQGENRDSPQWDLVFQSRSGPPSQPWLGPDIGEHLRRLAAEGAVRDVVLVPIGFMGEHMEVVYDLDVEAANLCDELGLGMERAEVVGSHRRFVQMIRELIEERLSENRARLALGPSGPWPDQCPAECCPAPSRSGR